MLLCYGPDKLLNTKIQFKLQQQSKGFCFCTYVLSIKMICPHTPLMCFCSFNGLMTQQESFTLIKVLKMLW